MLFLTYLSGTVASSLSGRCAHRWGAQRLLLVGIALMALGSALLLCGSLGAILSGLLISSFGFFLAHACASAWVGQHVEHNRALASSLYLVGYYLGASLGGLYLHPFWEQGGLGGIGARHRAGTGDHGGIEPLARSLEGTPRPSPHLSSLMPFLIPDGASQAAPFHQAWS